MSRSTKLLIVLAIIAGLGLVVLPAFADTWDATAQYSKTTNPNGTWSYGYSPTATYGFVAYTATLDWGDYNAIHAWQSDDAPGAKVNWSDFTTSWWGLAPQTPLLSADNASFYSIIRWTAPANGTYTVKALFRNGEFSAAYGHMDDVHVRKNTSTVLWDGQTGTFVPLRFEPVDSYHAVLTLTAGDTLDFLGHSSEGQYSDIGADIKIVSGSYIVSGHVQDSHGVALAGAKVAVAGLSFPGDPIVGSTSTYTVTDAAGNYSFSLFDGSYTLAATKSPYSEADQPVTVSGPGNYTVNFTMTDTGLWNAKTDFSLCANPNGNWSYGYATHNSEPMNTTGFQLSPVVDSFGYDNMYWAYWFWANSAPHDLWGNGVWPYQGVDFGTGNYYFMRPLGALNNDTVSILRWTAPSAGLFSFFGQWTNAMGSHTYGYSIVKNKTNVLVNNNALSGYSPNNVGPFNGYGSFAQGETLDFVTKAGDADDNRFVVQFDGSVKPGAPGIQGVVKDFTNAPIAGAKVVATSGAETFNVTTASDGTYTIVMHAGTFNVAASKAGYELASASGVVIVNDLVTENFTLPNGAIISGQVTQNVPPDYPFIAGANIYTSDGLYTTTTDSAGHYSLQVTRGTYSITYAKLGLAPTTVATNAAGNLTQNVRLNIGWDFATDFTNESNPVGPWAFGYATGTAGYKQSPDSFKQMTQNAHWAANPNTDAFWNAVTTTDPILSVWGQDPGSERPTFVKNITYSPLDQTNFLWYGQSAYREFLKVLAGESAMGNVYSVARFTAPTSGYFHVTAKFAGSTTSAPYTQSKVGLMYQNNYVFGGPSDVKTISGFVGRAVNGFTDSHGTSPVLQYDFDADIAMGERIDAVVFNDTNYGRYSAGAGWTQVDLTVSRHSSTLVGRVISSLPGNPAVAGATVVANGWLNGATYQTTTDVNGYYVISARADTYDMEARGPGYNTSASPAPVVLPDSGLTITNFTLNHSGTWNLANDYSAMSNPCGQWSYGYYLNTTAGGTNPGFTFVPLTHYGTILSTPGLMGWYDYPSYQPAWWVWFAKNTGSQPVPMLANYSGYDCYIEPNHVSLGGGDAWGSGGPAVRWTSPDNRLVSLNLTVAGQARAGMNGDISIFHNMAFSAEKTCAGFVGTAAAGFSDSVAPGGVATYATTVSVAAGDTLDFAMGHPADVWTHWYPVAGWPFRSHDLFLTIGPPPANTHQATTIADIKALAQGDTVIVTTPMQLGCATLVGFSFDKAYGNPTAGSGYCFYVQNADRTQGIKCITDGTVPTYDPTWKITFTGTIDIQQGQKVVRISSINSAVAGAAAKPMGKVGKSLSASQNGVLVKVWGKITQMVANTGADNDRWQYEYIVINDGSQDVKIPMHVQTNYMAGDVAITQLAVGHVIAVTGIAGTTTGSDLVVFPRNGPADIWDYTAIGQ